MANTDTKERYKNIAQNKKARYEYFIDETMEAGIVLGGTEVKSCRAGRASLLDAYATIDNNEAWLVNCHIAHYEMGNRFNREPMRKRKLLLHKKQIRYLNGKISQKGFTIVPLRMYFKGSKVKVELGLARGKALYDKRHTIKERDEKRIMEREFHDSKR